MTSTLSTHYMQSQSQLSRIPNGSYTRSGDPLLAQRAFKTPTLSLWPLQNGPMSATQRQLYANSVVLHTTVCFDSYNGYISFHYYSNIFGLTGVVPVHIESYFSNWLKFKHFLTIYMIKVTHITIRHFIASYSELWIFC